MSEEALSPERGGASAWVLPILGAVVCMALGTASGLSGAGGGSEWYRALEKPPGTPPPWVFAPVWTVLYILMGVACGRLIHLRAMGTVKLFVIQFLLNVAWTPVFFGAHQMGWALVILFLLWAFLAMTIWSAEKRDGVSAVLLLPYLLWVMYATYLNAGFVWLNRE